GRDFLGLFFVRDAARGRTVPHTSSFVGRVRDDIAGRVRGCFELRNALALQPSTLAFIDVSSLFFCCLSGRLYSCSRPTRTTRRSTPVHPATRGHRVARV